MVEALSLRLQGCYFVNGDTAGGGTDGTDYLDTGWASLGHWVFGCGGMRAEWVLSGNRAWAGAVAECAAIDAPAEDTGCGAAA